ECFEFFTVELALLICKLPHQLAGTNNRSKIVMRRFGGLALQQSLIDHDLLQLRKARHDLFEFFGPTLDKHIPNRGIDSGELLLGHSWYIRTNFEKLFVYRSQLSWAGVHCF